MLFFMTVMEIVDNFIQQIFSIEVALDLYSPVQIQSDKKAFKEAINNIEKLKESTSFLATPIESKTTEY